MSRFSSDHAAFELMRAGRFAQALPFAERAVAGARECLPAHGLLASILLQIGRGDDADAVICGALALDTGVADAYDALAFVSLHLGRHERANMLYFRATELAPSVPRFWYNLACSERSFGRLAEAETACNRAIALDDTQYPTYQLRSELRVQTPAANHVQELKARLQRSNLEDRAKVFLGYALAKELDDLGRFDEAFRWFSEAASVRRRHLVYDVAVDEHKLKRIAAEFDGWSPCRAARLECTARYIFVVGLPRTGTTLVERILTGLPGVRSNGETDNFSRALLASAPPGTEPNSDVFSRAAAADPLAVARNYVKLADVGAPARTIIEKLPMNYLYLGAIKRALPEATVLVLKRSPLDSCFAMYRTLFGEAYPFSYDFDELARYYTAYENLMCHWQRQLGVGLNEIIYEELVKDPMRVGNRIAHTCGLQWSDTAIEIQKNAAVSLTASAAQVRRPIYGSSSGRWRHYRAHLEPLIKALRRRGVILPDEVA